MDTIEKLKGLGYSQEAIDLMTLEEGKEIAEQEIIACVHCEGLGVFRMSQLAPDDDVIEKRCVCKEEDTR